MWFLTEVVFLHAERYKILMDSKDRIIEFLSNILEHINLIIGNSSSSYNTSIEFLSVSDVFIVRRNAILNELQNDPLLCPVIKGSDTLDVGFGSGGSLIALHTLGAISIAGIELDMSGCKIAKKEVELLSNIFCCSADGIRMPFGNNSFDFVLCHEVIEHVSVPKEFLLEIKTSGT